MQQNWRLYNLLNNVVGWVTFVIAAVVYLMTIGPSASLWDCPEFILSAFKLEVGHPPGAPIYMLVYNVAAHLAPTPELAGLYTNALSGLLSAGTILLLFWSITHLVRRVVLPGASPCAKQLIPEGVMPVPTLAQTILIMGSGLVGALLYTFTDTFWYSAVESEVYAFSSFLTALVFWLMLKWSDRADNARSDRWIVLIAYVMGLSIGVHLLNLLCIPAMALIYYFRKHDALTFKGIATTLIVSLFLIAVIMFGIMQGVVAFGGTIDRWVVNGLKMPYNSGFYIYLAVLMVVLVGSLTFYQRGERGRNLIISSFLLSWCLIGIPYFGGAAWLGVIVTIALAIYLFQNRKVSLQLLHTAQMCMLVIMIGFSSYGVILVRSLAGTPMNQNEPNTALAIKSYINREQYGAIPHLYSATYVARPIAMEEGKPVYAPKVKGNPNEPDEYVKIYNQPEVKYAAGSKMLFPRMYSPQPEHISAYNSWVDRNPDDMSKPSMADNLKYLLRYQVNYMYWRYFGWNFIGRQNDLQGDGGMLKGGVLTGYSFIDQIALGKTKDLPDQLRNNKGRNAYYLLPLLLGFLGIAFQVTRRKKGMQAFWITLVLFFMTGLAIILYINQTPGQPRERDYAYAGSFYAFAIWIGFGVAGLYELLSRAKLKPLLTASIVSVLGLIVPIQMASENWDDHDRSGRVLASDFGYNYLISCDPNAVLLCFGDNDTFPLWYAQEVEGVRTDVKEGNLSYLQSEWYGKHMLRHSYEAQPIPNKYMSPAFFVTNSYALIRPTSAAPMPFDQAMKEATKIVPQGQSQMPADKVLLPVDSAAVAKQFPQLQGLPMPKSMVLSLEGKSVMTRDQLFVLDMLGASEWQRPIMWVSSAPQNVFANQRQYMSYVGMAQRFNPTTVAGTPYEVDVERLYDLVMNKYRYFNANDPDIYFDENIRRNISYYYRSRLFATLGQALLRQGDVERAKEVLTKCAEVISPKAVPYDMTDVSLADAYYRAKMTEQGDEIVRALFRDTAQLLYWVSQQKPSHQLALINDSMVRYSLVTLMDLVRIDMLWGRNLLAEYETMLQQALPTFGGSLEAVKEVTAQQLGQRLSDTVNQ